ncbi:MAG: DUF47 domain-containing protein [Prevotella sp.]
MFGIKTRKKINATINCLDQFLDALDECVLVFKSGVKNYLDGNSEAFNENMRSLTDLRNRTTDMRRSIENDLYSYTLVVDNRVDLLRLLECLDKIIDLLYKNLCQYEIEVPFFPAELNVDFLKLVEIAALSMEGAVQASKEYMRMPRFVTEKIHRIYYFEREVNKLAQSIKRHVFHDMENFKLSQKIHLRYFTLHVEELAVESVRVADQLSVMMIKQNNM